MASRLGPDCYSLMVSRVGSCLVLEGDHQSLALGSDRRWVDRSWSAFVGQTVASDFGYQCSKLSIASQQKIIIYHKPITVEHQ